MDPRSKLTNETAGTKRSNEETMKSLLKSGIELCRRSMAPGRLSEGFCGVALHFLVIGMLLVGVGFVCFLVSCLNWLLATLIVISIGAGMCAARKLPFKVCGILVIIVMLVFWGYQSISVARFSFSKDRRCELVFHEWLTGRCVLSYYENDICIGKVILTSDLFDNPLAFFPGADGNSVVCLSWPDTFYAAFTVDFTTRNDRGVVVPPVLVTRDAVDFSNFKVRACTRKEVDFVTHYIKTVDLNSLSHLTRWGAREETTEDTREGLLRCLIWATARRDSGDPVAKFATPLILPDDPELESRLSKLCAGMTLDEVKLALSPTKVPYGICDNEDEGSAWFSDGPFDVSLTFHRRLEAPSPRVKPTDNSAGEDFLVGGYVEKDGVKILLFGTLAH